MSHRSIEAKLDFLTPIEEIKGLGPKRAHSFYEAGINTLGDLLYQFPRRYIDRSTIYRIDQIEKYLGSICTVKATVRQVRFEPGRKSKLRVLVSDSSGELELIWFQGAQYFRTMVKPDMMLLITGKVGKYRHIQIVHPSIEVVDDENEGSLKKFVPQYSLTSTMRESGIQQKVFSNSVDWVLQNLRHFPRVLPAQLEEKKKFPPLETCLRGIHQPDSLQELDLYRSRIAYEELYKTAVTLFFSKKKFKQPGRSMLAGNLPERFKKYLTFELTKDQKDAIAVLHEDARNDSRMHRLLQGDVGSGKTLVAFFSCLPALNENLQVAWLAPTDVLARQTWQLITGWLKPFGIATGFLNGALNTTGKKEIYSQIASGDIRFIVGTHALLQPQIRFKNLGMVVIDEQHKFGAQQRLTLQEKDPLCDFLLMSATPIPQSLAMTLYGDLEILTIKKGPPGRIPVATHLVPESKRHDMEQFILDQIRNEGAQVYYVVPRIDGDDDEIDSSQKSLVDLCETLLSGVFHSIQSGFIHGKLSNEEKLSVMESFSSGTIKLLLTTSVIEVGIDVADATIIVIENAERFGLAQLHQLRGRVGRGKKKSYCFLLNSRDTLAETETRLRMFCANHDGFKIAEYDLKSRGPGEISGFRQSGWGDMVFEEIIKTPLLFKEVQDEVERIFIT